MRESAAVHRELVVSFKKITDLAETGLTRNLYPDEEERFDRLKDEIPLILSDLFCYMPDARRPRLEYANAAFVITESLDMFESRYVETFENVQRDCADYLENKTEHYRSKII